MENQVLEKPILFTTSLESRFGAIYQRKNLPKAIKSENIRDIVKQFESYISRSDLHRYNPIIFLDENKGIHIIKGNYDLSKIKHLCE